MSLSGAAMELFAKLSLDSKDFDEGLSQAKEKASGFGSMLSTGLKVAAGIGTAAFSAAGVAVKNLTDQAVSSYASFEQLEGGVKKLYGTAADELMGYAQKAYQTSGMSANQYMETATSCSAAMIKSLDGDVSEAAKMTDIAMRAMSDNINTFGTDAEAVSNAFMGLSRNNYMMIDNLKLGYAGTAQGMMELINDSGVLGKTLTDTSELANVGFANMVKAIEEVQKQQNIAGTTAREAMTTIEGSATATKAAWENVITAMGRGEGLSDAFDGLVTSIFGEKEGEGLLNQIIPRIETTLSSIGDFLVTAAPLITEKIPDLIEAIVPSFLSATMNMVSAIGTALPDVFSSLMDIIMTEGLNLIRSLSEGLKTGVPEFLSNILPMLVSFTGELRQNFGEIVNAGIDLILSLVEGLVAGLPDLIKYVPEIVINIAGLINDNMPKILQAGLEIIITLGKGIIDNIPVIIENMGKIVEAIFAVIQAVNWLDLGSKVVQLIGKGIKALFSLPVNIFKDIGKNVFNTFKNGFSWGDLGRAVIDGIVSGIKGAGRAIGDTLMGFARDAWSSVKKFFGIASPSKLMRDTIGKFIPAGMAEGIEENSDSVAKAMSDLSDLTMGSFDLGTPNFGISGTGGLTAGNITINVYGAEGQDVRELAEEVGRILTDQELRRRASYA